MSATQLVAQQRARRSALAGVRTGLSYLPFLAAGLDTVLILLAGFVAARSGFDLVDPSSTVSNEAVALVIAGLWLGTTALVGAYRRDLFGVSTDEYKRVFNAAVLTAALVSTLSYLSNYPLSRGFFLVLFVTGAPSLLIGRLLLRRVIHAGRRRGIAVQRVLIAGSLRHTDEVAAVLRREPSLGYDVVGVLTPVHEATEESTTGIPVLGTPAEVCQVAAEAQADVVVFAGGAYDSAQQFREIVWELEAEELHVVVAPSVSEISGERITVRPVGGLPLMHIDPPTWVKAARIGKRLFDVAGSIAILLLLSPVLVACALRIKLHDGGPVLFRQTRIGKDGVEFDCFKFRTMVVNAEEMLADLHAHQEFAGGLFKMRRDPRITGPGRWLRRYSLDEMPQLLNVLRGGMSLVGPRPPLPSEVQAYADQTSRRLRVRPGMTGLWQVSGRSDLSWEEAIRLDLYYVDNWSMMQDLSILVRTVGAVVSSRGAY